MNRLSGLKKSAASLAGHCFYWTAVLFVLYKASCCCFCSTDLPSDANSDLRSLKEGRKEALVANMTGCYCEIITLLSFPFLILHVPHSLLIPGYSSLCSARLLDRGTYFCSSAFMRDIYSWGHIVLVLATRHLMRLAQPLGRVFVAFTCRWKFLDSQ